MMHAVIYARFSTDKQRETSIEDQARVCRARAVASGWEVGETFSDVDTSGQTIVSQRAGASRLLEAIRQGGIDILLIESLDRLARDLIEQESTVRRLEHRGLRIIGVSDGYDTAVAGRELMRGVRGLINESYIRDLRVKTHRGLAGQVERGYHAGGISYGYRSVIAGLDPKGEPVGHRLEINEDQAKWVRWIFAQYAAGLSCQRIAAELNRQQVKGPRGGTWCVSALYGSPIKGSGVLNNESYIGRYIWNRSQWIKDPDTRKRVRIQRPENEWCIEERPELRILDDASWAAVRSRMSVTRLKGGTKGKGAKPSTLFGGLMKCGICGGAIVAVSKTSYGCAAHKDRGTTVCAGVSAPRNVTDTRLLGVIRDDILAPQAIAMVRKMAHEVAAERLRGASSAATDRQVRSEELNREIKNLVDAIASYGFSPALRDKLAEAEAERSRLEVAVQPAPITRSVEDVLARYRRLVADLPQSLQKSSERARNALRTLLGDIRLIKEGDAVFAEVEASPQRLFMASGGSILGVVAGTGFEPVTFGL